MGEQCCSVKTQSHIKGGITDKSLGMNIEMLSDYEEIG